MKLRIDLNCDVGEGAGHDAALMPLITSANIACGGHAGDAATMRATVALAQRHGVAIGAHPGFVDREHCGRRELDISPRDAARLVVVQIQALQEIALAMKAEVRHVKLHGALYHMASRDEALARGIVEAVWCTEWKPIFFVLAGSTLERVARANTDIRVVSEVYADRTYRPDGTLTPRSAPGALIRDERVAVAQVLRMIREGVVRATDGRDIPIAAGTVCVHGDGPSPVEFARRLRAEFAGAGIEVGAP